MFQIHHYISENYQTYRGTQFNLTLCDLPIKTLLASQRNQIYSEASSTHFSAINLSYFTLYSSKCSLFQIHHYISENYQTYRGTQFNLTLCDLPIKKLLASQRNQIYSEASSTHFSAINLSYFTLYSSICSLFQIHHRHFSTLSDLRRTQFNLTLLIYQSKTSRLSTQSNTYLKHLQHTFQQLIYHTLRFTHQNAHCSKYITTFQKTIRLIAEHNSIWHSVIYQSKHFSPPNAIKYILKHLQHTFQLLIYHIYALLIKMLIVPNTSLHFRKLSDLSRNTIQFNTLRFTNQKLLASQRNQIYSEASSTHFSAINLSYTYALPSYSLLIQSLHIYQTYRGTQFNLTLCDLPIKITSHLPTQSNIFWSIFNTSKC